MKSSGSSLKEFRPASVSWVRRSSIAFSAKEISQSVQTNVNDHSYQTQLNTFHNKDLTSVDDSKNEQQLESTPHIRPYSLKSIYFTKDFKNANETEEEKEEDDDDKKDQSIKREIKSTTNESRRVSVTWIKRNSIHSISNKSIQKKNLKDKIEFPQIENLIPLNPNQKDKSKFNFNKNYYFQSSQLTKTINEKQRKQNNRYVLNSFEFFKFFFSFLFFL